jgi:hypothetical protein
MCMVLPYSVGSCKYPFYVCGVALLSRFLEVLIDCMAYGMYWIVGAWNYMLLLVLRAIIVKQVPPL